MNNIEEDFRLFQLVRRKPIKNCIDLTKGLREKRSGIFYFTEDFRIDFENKMCDLERLKAERKQDQAMTKEQEEAIKYLEESILIYKNAIPKMSKAIETVLSMLKQNSAELAEKSAEIEKKDKIINEMARFITNKDIDEDICRYQAVKHCKDEEYGVTIDVCINCIKQYFERKSE